MKIIVTLASLLLLITTALAQDPMTKALFDRSDLIVLAQFPLEKSFDGFIGSGPIPNPAFAQNSYAQYLTRIQVVSVLKGDPKDKENFLISLTLAYSDKDAQPSIPKTNQRYIIFLEDISKREPAASIKSGNEIIRFRNFDSYISYIPEDKALINKLMELKKAEPVRPANPPEADG